MTILRAESIGSYWYLDEDAGTYVRTPKEEKPREAGWGSQAGVLADLVTHPMAGWHVAWGRLTIECTDRPGHVISAPLSWQEEARLKAIEAERA